MAKRKISAAELVSDIKSGMADAALVEKYSISHDQLQVFLRTLVDKGILTQADIDGRAAHRTKPAPKVSPAPSPDPATAESPTRPCPYCAEDIRVGAKKCKHCGEFLEPSEREKVIERGREHASVGGTVAGETRTESKDAPAEFRPGRLGGLLTAFVSFLVCLIVGSLFTVFTVGPVGPALAFVAALYLAVRAYNGYMNSGTRGSAAPSTDKPAAKSKAGVFAVVAICVLVVIGIVLAVAIPYYVAYKRVACDKIASHDLERLGAALERLDVERKDLMNCPQKTPPSSVIAFMVGPYYGWSGTTAKADVRVWIEKDEICACALKGSRPQGQDTRVIYRMNAVTGARLPSTTGPCRGNSYGGVGATTSILGPDCAFHGCFAASPPDDWKVKSSATEKGVPRVEFEAPGGQYVGISVLASPSKQTTDALYAEAQEKASKLKGMFPQGSFNVKKDSLGDHAIIVFSNVIPGKTFQELVQFQSNGVAYTIDLRSETQSGLDAHRSTFKKFLNSFVPLGT